MKKQEADEDCKPEKIELEDKFHSANLNCTECLQTDCFYWHIYHEDYLKKQTDK